MAPKSDDVRVKSGPKCIDNSLDKNVAKSDIKVKSGPNYNNKSVKKPHMSAESLKSVKTGPNEIKLIASEPFKSVKTVKNNIKLIAKSDNIAIKSGQNNKNTKSVMAKEEGGMIESGENKEGGTILSSKLVENEPFSEFSSSEIFGTKIWPF